MLAIGRRLLVAGRQVAIRHVGQWGRGAGGGREQVAEVVVDVAFLACISAASRIGSRKSA